MVKIDGNKVTINGKTWTLLEIDCRGALVSPRYRLQRRAKGGMQRMTLFAHELGISYDGGGK